ncbi:MAG: Crp/Fnr family transcriptional regulator [Chitinophagaceae bacterium]|nr:Crp/Fnr family transcriptional regulator [Rubrivivax sp.]
MTRVPSQRRDNAMLSALPAAEWQRWEPLIEAVELRAGQVLCEPGRAPEHVYFPATAIVSLLHMMEDGGSVEVAAVGREGLVGYSVFMGGNSTASQAVVQSAGRALRLPARAVKASFEAGGPVTMLLLRYTQALIAEIGQTAACNRHHSLGRQLCRCLLHNLDRAPGNQLVMTHELIARLLGVRREGVSERAIKLQQAGLIRYARGHISVLDRPGLEARSCECYGVIRGEYKRLLPQVPQLSLA